MATPAVPNAAVDDKIQNISAAEQELAQVRNEMSKLNERLRDLKAHEGTLQAKIIQMKHEHRAMLAIDTDAKAKQIQATVTEKESKMRQLQAQLEALNMDREKSIEELNGVLKKGIIDGRAAGAKQVSVNAANSRYDLINPNVATGLSQDPLAQTTGQGENPFQGRPIEKTAVSIDDIGQHDSASPYVRPEDYKIEGDRPQTPGGNKSAKFSDWKTPNRNATRIAQPPGGFSSMGNIFG
eukprot:m.270039 g.270039  ORF g.270039 m.270039 type:complete len:239 (+) comp16261_c3_seq1:42-758(+)